MQDQTHIGEQTAIDTQTSSVTDLSPDPSVSAGPAALPEGGNYERAISRDSGEPVPVNNHHQLLCQQTPSQLAIRKRQDQKRFRLRTKVCLFDSLALCQMPLVTSLPCSRSAALLLTACWQKHSSVCSKQRHNEAHWKLEMGSWKAIFWLTQSPCLHLAQTSH